MPTHPSVVFSARGVSKGPTSHSHRRPTSHGFEGHHHTSGAPGSAASDAGNAATAVHQASGPTRGEVRGSGPLSKKRWRTECGGVPVRWLVSLMWALGMSSRVCGGSSSSYSSYSSSSDSNSSVSNNGGRLGASCSTELHEQLGLLDDAQALLSGCVCERLHEMDTTVLLMLLEVAAGAARDDTAAPSAAPSAASAAVAVAAASTWDDSLRDQQAGGSGHGPPSSNTNM
eukprot:scaffold106774_cov21-Tisochrysis_lutea.AAC.1